MGALDGKAVVFTGTLNMDRNDAKVMAQDQGAIILSSITSRTNLVVAGEKSGAKLDKAEKLGIEVWTEDEFLEQCNSIDGNEETDTTTRNNKNNDDSPRKRSSPKRTLQTQEENDDFDDAVSVVDDDDDDVDDDIYMKNNNKKRSKKSKILTLQGRVICFIGTLSTKRTDAIKWAKQSGATVASSLTKKVEVLIAGEEAGEKIDKAKDNGCEIWSERDFTSVAAGAPSSSRRAAAAAKKESSSKIKRSEGSRVLEGKVVCFIGSLSMKRMDATQMAKDAGATVAPSLTKKVQILVAGPGAGSKRQKAEAQGCEIWSEDLFLSKVSDDDDDEAEAEGEADEEQEEEEDEKSAKDEEEEKDESGDEDEDEGDEKEEKEKKEKETKEEDKKVKEKMKTKETGGNEEEDEEGNEDYPEEDEEEQEEAEDEDYCEEEEQEEAEEEEMEDVDEDDEGEEEARGLSLDGKVICFIGTLSSIKRGEAKQQAEDQGAIVAGSISKKVDIVVAGEKAGDKITKAKKLGCEIWTEEEFSKTIE